MLKIIFFHKNTDLSKKIIKFNMKSIEVL